MPIEVTSGFIESALVDNYISSGNSDVDEEALRLKRLHSISGLHKLDSLACINTYAKQFQTQGSVLLVTENLTSIIYNNVLTGRSNSTTFLRDWVCNDDDLSCDISSRTKALRSDPASWHPGDTQLTIAYCLSEQLPEKCKVQSSLHLAIVVILLSLMKAMIMLGLAFRVKESPIMTIGDAVASYLWRSDRLMENMCIVSKKDIKQSRTTWPKEPKTFKSKRRRLFLAASKTRWTLCISM